MLYWFKLLDIAVSLIAIPFLLILTFNLANGKLSGIPACLATPLMIFTAILAACLMIQFPLAVMAITGLEKGKRRSLVPYIIVKPVRFLITAAVLFVEAYNSSCGAEQVTFQFSYSLILQSVI